MNLDEHWLELGLGAALGVVVLLTASLFPTTLLTSALLIAFLLYQAHSLGHRLTRSSHPIAASLVGLLALLATQATLLTVWYWLDGIGSLTIDAIALVLSAAGLHVLLGSWKSTQQSEILHSIQDDPRKTSFLKNLQGYWATGLLGLSLLACAYILRAAQLNATTEAIRTTWAALPTATLFAFAVLALIPWLIAWLEPRKPVLTAVAVSLFLFATVSITPLLYPLGYGFDGFLHRATENLFITQGTLEPKPLYYIGQYTFVSFLSRLTGLAVGSIDLWLVPAFASLLPLLFALFDRRRASWSVAALTLLLPLAPFIATTPQSLAYLIGLIALLAALSETSLLLTLVLAAWCVAIHPLAGLPLGGTALALLMLRSPHAVWKKASAAILLTLACLSVPASFFLLGSGSSVRIDWHTDQLFRLNTLAPNLASLLPPSSHVSLWSDWADLAVWLAPLLLLIGAVLAILRDRTRRTAWIASLAVASGLWLASLFLKHAGEFTFLIDYERGDYPERLLTVSLLILLPAACVGFGLLLKNRLPTRTPALAACLLGCVVIFATGQVYNAFPRHDASQTGHGWNTSRSDFEAARFIDRDAAGEPYTVLANQSVSAAAVATLGFKRYAGDIFFYPIPTGGPLYQTFLRVTGNAPSTDDIKEAASLGQSRLVYVVLNKYWWDAELVAQRLSALTDAKWSFGQEAVTVYRFTINPSNASR